jgi:hypothetical protein
MEKLVKIIHGGVVKPSNNAAQRFVNFCILVGEENAVRKPCILAGKCNKNIVQNSTRFYSSGHSDL